MEQYLVTGLFNLYTAKKFGIKNETMLVEATERTINELLKVRLSRFINNTYYPLLLNNNRKLYHCIPVHFDTTTKIVTSRLISNLRGKVAEDFWNTDEVQSTFKIDDINNSYPFSNIIKDNTESLIGEEMDGLYQTHISKLYQVSYGVSIGRVDYSGPLSLFNNQILTNLYNTRPTDESEFRQKYGIFKTGPVYNERIFEWYTDLFNYYDTF
jgi:hypothetical protein